MSLFYAPDLKQCNILPEEESQHAIKVLRLTSGDIIDVVDGRGLHCKGRITLPHAKHCEFEIIDGRFEPNPRNFKLHIAIAPTKNIERLEWFIEKATEIGIDEITPVVCRFSERKIIKAERLEKIIVSASKQSLKAYFPKLNPLCSFQDFLVQHKDIYAQQFIAHCYEGEKPLLKYACKPSTDTLILIGPEGDFSPEEVKEAIHLNFQTVSLGESRLRTETAGIVACDTVGFVNQ